MPKVIAEIPAEIQKTIATTAGMVVTNFNPKEPIVPEELRQKILFATSGGVNVTCVATYKDNGEDIDNCVKGSKEMNAIERWDAKMSGTAVTITNEVALSHFGAADVKGTDFAQITPRMEIDAEDYKTIGYLAPYGIEGGFVYIELSNALSTGGFSLQSEDKGKNKYSFEYTAFPSLENPQKVPFDFYLKKTESAEPAPMKVKV